MTEASVLQDKPPNPEGKTQPKMARNPCLHCSISPNSFLFLFFKTCRPSSLDFGMETKPTRTFFNWRQAKQAFLEQLSVYEQRSYNPCLWKFVALQEHPMTLWLGIPLLPLFSFNKINKSKEFLSGIATNYKSGTSKPKLPEKKTEKQTNTSLQSDIVALFIKIYNP